ADEPVGDVSSRQRHGRLRRAAVGAAAAIDAALTLSGSSTRNGRARPRAAARHVRSCRVAATYGSPSTPPRRLARLAATQHGVFTRAQAIACGVSARTATRRLSSGMWDRLYPAVYRVAGSPETWRQAPMAACL